MLKYVEAEIHPPAGEMAKAIAFQHEIRADVDGGKIAINWFFQEDTGTYWHNGGTGGFRSYAFFNPKLEVGGVVLVNRSSGLADALGGQIAALLEGKEAGPLQR
jgi:CubicO group peptidase (beta-lactamase class C family)